MSTLKRSSLGQRARLGDLYDARIDAFLNESLVTGELPVEAITCVAVNQSKSTVGTTDTLKAKFEKLGMSDDVTASFLAGMIEPKGSAKYLLQKRHALPVVHRALHYTVTTRQETINFSSPSLTYSLDLSALASGTATHVVAGITWGGRAIMAASRRLPAGADRTTYESEMDEIFKNLNEPSYSPLSASSPFADASENTLAVKVFSDFPDNDNDPPETMRDAFTHIRGIEMRIKSDSEGKGKPLTYTLLPISFLITLGAFIPEDINVGQLSTECVEKYVTLLDDLGMAHQSVTAYLKTLKSHSSVVRAEHLVQVQDKLKVFPKREMELMSTFAQLLPEIRNGRSSSYKVWQLVEDTLGGDMAPKKFLSMTDEYVDKLEFIATVVDLGAEYLSLTGQPAQAIRRHIPQRGTSYIFFFSNEVMNTHEKWEEHVELLLELLKERPRAQSIIIADCCSNDSLLSEVYISAYCNGEMKTKDLLAHKKIVADKHMIRFVEADVERIDNMPSVRRAVFLPCPHPNCDGQVKCEWTCFTCHVAMEYSPSDDYFYCECGKIPVDVARFNCQTPEHGEKYIKYPPGKLSRLLQNLAPPPELNILILGETGVGKSTFINAFVNYLTFSTLDEGMEAARLNCVIPCSFETQITDSNTGRLISQEVKIGSDDNESDAKGASATQQATVYPIYLGGTLVRLIDTPGIGDVRGIDQDKHNLVNILSVLRNYADLHGILILLKPNNARLNVMFRFCVKELLSSLHRSAAENIAFGFTNTRGSDYKPGDTFAPLARLLSDYEDVIPGLFHHNVYCFDSESFRYLAAQKQGIDMGTIEDYRRSWDQSTKETDRLLAYFRSLAPHHVQATLSLNETRHLISQLTAPMQQISQAITDSIAKSEQQIHELSNIKLTGKDLVARLKIQKVVVKATALTQPKTVCSNESCVTPVQNSAGGGTVLLRKSLCHNPCYLTEVPVNQVGTSKLAGCAAFSGKWCTKCRHEWREHEHIMVEWSQTSESSTDPRVQQELNANGNLATAKEAQVKALQTVISELKNEHQAIQEAAAKFSFYMKNNSITHYNDATIDYLDHLIKDEKSKVRAGENRDRLDRLERDKVQYESYVAAMESGKLANRKNSAAALDERGVAALVQQLYNLKHYGTMLRDVSKVVSNAYAANFRERPFRIRGKQLWMESYHGSQNQNPVLWIPKRQNFRQSAIEDLDRDCMESGTNDKKFKGFVSKLRKRPPPKAIQEKEDVEWLESRPSNGEKGRPSPVKSLASWDDEDISGQGRRSTPSTSFPNEKSSTSDTADRSPGNFTAGPPPYTEVSEMTRNRSVSYGSTTSRPSLWSKMKDRFRGL